ncbi:hypothetical protein F5I97DRAFT_1802529 [Phlebopus sp. FC_14]|nr:hypothetical protein F5I97DRAFT_1802529 [Phlebopus sp. FC_14]
MTMSEYLVTDDLTVLLGFIGVTVFLLQNLYKPQPLVHPILLGRQSDAGRVRQPGESPVYRNYGTGLMGRFPIRPDKDVVLVNDLVKSQYDSPRTLWSTKITNGQLQDRIAAFGAGISRLIPDESSVLLLLNDSVEFIIADLALAKYSIASLTLSSPKLLTHVLETYSPSALIIDGDFLPCVLELLYDAREHHQKIIVVGEVLSELAPKSGGEVETINWRQVEADGAKLTTAALPPTPRSNDPYTICFFETPTGEIRAARFTHENFTSGVTAIRSMFPPSIALSTLDTITSGHSLSTPYGRTIAYAALHECTSFATLDSARPFDTSRSKDVHDFRDVFSATKRPIPPPTILFVRPAHLQDLTSCIISRAKKSWMYSLGWRHKIAGLMEGFVSKESLWDRVVFDAAREFIMGRMAGTLKAVVVSGGPLPNDELTPARIALSVPIINSHSHPSTSGPLFATHALDLQTLPSSGGEPAHVGGPSVNVEVKLAGLRSEDIESMDPVGEICVRGPSVGTLLPLDQNLDEADSNGEWVKTGELGRVLTNGAFKVL